MKVFILLASLMAWSSISFSQSNVPKDSVVLRIIYRDTIVYRYDTVRIRRFIQSDTLWTGTRISSVSPKAPKKKGLINPNSWGIGPSVGAYYSPYNGFDVNFGFGIQYYLLAVPSFRNPHLGRKRQK